MSNTNDQQCPLTQALTVIGGKWKPIIISHLRRSPKRFGQLNVAIPEISRKVLSSQLSELVRDDLLTRHSYSESPPRVEYQLTEKARALIPIFEAMAEWGKYLIDKNVQIDGLKEKNYDT